MDPAALRSHSSNPPGSVRNRPASPRPIRAPRSFAELLYRHRIAAGLSRLELAGLVQCSENYVYRLESRDLRHRRVPTPWLVRALSEALGLGPDQNESLLRARDRLCRVPPRRRLT